MDKFKTLSGDQLVALGARKNNVSLPELGLKDVTPNGSWLEQKQIQVALEARKHLIEVERIEKRGVLSQGHWREDLQLVEVTQNVGGHWQYLGHCVSGRLYLNPEEALHLMELNALHLQYNEVTVSLQQAYTLLLRDKISLFQYKVYSSLSRLGYKVFRHKPPKKTVDINNDEKVNEVNSTLNSDEGNKKVCDNLSEDHKVSSNEMEIGTVTENPVSSSENVTETPVELSNDKQTSCDEIKHHSSELFIRHQLECLSNRQLRPCKADVIDNSLKENIPNLLQKEIVTIKAPEEQYIPRNVFLNNTAYVLNLENLRLKTIVATPSSSSRTYTISNEVNRGHVRRIRNLLANEGPSNWNPVYNARFQQYAQFRPFNFFNQFHFNMAYQRPFFPSMPFRFQFLPRMPPLYRCFPNIGTVANTQFNAVDSRKRKHDCTKKYHEESIRKLAAKLKILVDSGNVQEQNIQALHRLVNTYNVRYKTRLRITDDLILVEDENIVETIELDDDEQLSPKKRKSESKNYFEKHLNALKEFATKIKNLEAQNMSSARHRRAFSNAIRTFNKSFNADIYVDSNYDIVDRKNAVTLASEKEHSCNAQEKPKAKKSKMVRNPFNILKQLSEKNKTNSGNDELATNSRELIGNNKYNDKLSTIFNDKWLPDFTDFGRAEVVQRSQMNGLIGHSQDFLYDFIKSQNSKFENWLEAKIAFWETCETSAKEYQSNAAMETNVIINSLVTLEDCTDLQSVLKKLNIIKTSREVGDDSSLKIDFDVYNRDVQNFKKSNPPKPHFRIICTEETTAFPTGSEIAALHSQYTDDVTIIFAIVGTASISYLQVNPSDLPVYIPNSNLP